MKRFSFKMLLVASAVLSAVGLFGCGGGDDNPADNNGGGNSIAVVDPNTVVKSSFPDSRDGKTYKTVKIGRQTWMAENLNYQTEESWCYGEGGRTVFIGPPLDKERTRLSDDEVQANCNTYGRLYTLNAAKTVCPAGWKLPDTADWDKLRRAAGYVMWGGNEGKKLKSTSGWDDFCGGTMVNDSSRICNGTDDYGFSALPGGYMSDTHEFYSNAGQVGSWWTSTMGYGDQYYMVFIDNHFGSILDMVGWGDRDPHHGYSVRCIQG
jgi:uncharacterized protein (TIGR02145 family)